MAKFSEKIRVVERVRTEAVEAHVARSWGAPLVFGRLWERQRMPEVLQYLAKDRRFEFDAERACFALALQRLCAPGSDLRGAKWLPTVECPGFDRLDLQHLYRAVGFLGGVRERLEHALFLQDRDLFSQEIDVIFIDTTSTFLYSPDTTPLRQRGYSRDRMPQLPQLIVCLCVDARGWPIAWDFLPGNTADKTAFVATIHKLRERFRIRRAIVVADRGMISEETLRVLEDHADAPFEFILGCRMRRQKEVNEDVLSRAGRFQHVEDNLEVKEVFVEGRRYVVCRNPTEVKKDAAARDAMVTKLEEAIRQGPKSMMGNKGYARFTHIARGAVTINRDAIDADARLDGKFVLRTNTQLPTAEVAKAYKSLWRVERAFRETKNTLEVRPIFHQRDDTTVGHIVGCFLALRLEVDLQSRLDENGADVSWPDVIRDLQQVKSVEMTLDGERYQLRTALHGTAAAAFAAAGVRPPPTCTHLGPEQPPVA